MQFRRWKCNRADFAVFEWRYGDHPAGLDEFDDEKSSASLCGCGGGKAFVSWLGYNTACRSYEPPGRAGT